MHSDDWDSKYQTESTEKLLRFKGKVKKAMLTLWDLLKVQRKI